MAMISQVEPHPVTRPLANFAASVWGDRFTSISSSYNPSELRAYSKDMIAVKEEVRGMLMDGAAPVSTKMNLINLLDRLGLSYHFDKEIQDQLQNIFHSQSFDSHDNEENDLHTISVQFRVFRQHGYKISCDVFNRFVDSCGKFKEVLTKDAKGMLSLYEAAQLSLRSEEILDEALVFTTTHLRRMAAIQSPCLAKQITRALKQPFHKGIPRIESRVYILAYEEEEYHNETLLKFAKLDFNLLQSQHQQELGQISKWWSDLQFASRLPYARNRIVECFFWSTSVFYEKEYSFARQIFAKIIAISSIIDDTYDAYGLLEELRLFTDVVERWDISATDQLPDYMKIVYETLLDIYDEMEEQLHEEGRSQSIGHLKKLTKELIRAYQLEAEWLNQRYVPKFEEYMQNASVTSGYKFLSTICFIGEREVADEEAFLWIQSNPQIVRAAEIICRLQDDLVCETELERPHLATAIECYMKHYGVSKEEAIEELKKRITNAWKEANEQCLNPAIVPRNLLLRILNLARIIDVVYKEEDGYTCNSAALRDCITSLFIDPVPM